MQWISSCSFNFSDTQNVGQNEWNAWYKREIRSYQMKKTWFGPKIKWGMWRGWVWSVWKREKWVSIKRDRRKMREDRAEPLYRNPWFLMDWEVLRIKICQKELSRGVHSKVTSMDREAIEHLLSIQKLPRWIKKLLRSYRGKFSKFLSR